MLLLGGILCIEGDLLGGFRGAQLIVDGKVSRLPVFVVHGLLLAIHRGMSIRNEVGVGHVGVLLYDGGKPNAQSAKEEEQQSC